MWHYWLTYCHLQKTKLLLSFQESTTLSRCVTHWHKVWKLVPGLYIGNRHELVSFRDTSCVRVIFILICPWINLKQTCMVNPLVFTRITFLVSTVNTAFVNTVLGNLQKWCDLISQDYDSVVWLGTNTINKYIVFIEDKAGISWEVLLVTSCCISYVLHTWIQWLGYPLFTESVWVIL